jgi:LDH2 family malate/lactate/ureidoglycolate dehydrogenase
MPTETVTVSDADLRGLVTRTLRAVGVPEAAAHLMADAMVYANLRGVDSHGVQLLPAYVRQIEAKNVQPEARGRVVSESGACLVYDGENGLGCVVSEACCGHAVRLAREHGLGLVTARGSNHFGTAAFWAEKISAQGMIGVVMCNASPRVAPWQGREGRFGTNPLCMSLPVEPPDSWLLDMATTTVAVNKIYNAAAKGETTIPSGWAMDAGGAPTNDVQTALAGLLMPLGGYKGSGLAFLVEILCGVLSGGAMSSEVGGLYLLDCPSATGQCFLALDVARYMPIEEFRARVGALVRHVKSARPAEGYSEVLVAGDPEWQAEATRRRDGIPLAKKVWEKLLALEARLGQTD